MELLHHCKKHTNQSGVRDLCFSYLSLDVKLNYKLCGQSRGEDFNARIRSCHWSKMTFLKW